MKTYSAFRVKLSLKSLFIILGLLSVFLLVAKTTVRGQAQIVNGKIVLSVIRFDTKELKVTVSLDININFKEEQGDWLLMQLVHVDQNGLQDASYINLTMNTVDPKNYQGTGELVFELTPVNTYPFDEYNMTVILYDGDSFNRTKIEKPALEVDLNDQMQSVWTVANRAADFTTVKNLLPDNREVVYFSLVIQRQVHVLAWILLPIFLSLSILYLSTLLDTNRRDWLSNRITIYVSLFVFVFTFQNVILSDAPLRIGVSPGELLIYLVAINTVVLFLASILKSYSASEEPLLILNEKDHFWESYLTIEMLGLFVVVVVDLAVFSASFARERMPAPLIAIPVILVLLPILIGTAITNLRAKRFKNIDYLLNYVTIAISEGLVTNIKRGIRYLINKIEEAIPSYDEEMSEPDSILTFLSDILIANVNTTYVRDTILRGYANIFEVGVKKSSVITYTVSAQLRMLSEQITRRENSLASRKLLFTAHELFDRSLEKKYSRSIIEDASITYHVISKDILKEKLSTIISLNTILMGTPLLRTIERAELEHMSLRLLDLLEEYVAECIKIDDPTLIRAVKYHARQNLDMIRPRLARREALLRRINELERRAGLP